jgi:hypothetical protein
MAASRSSAASRHRSIPVDGEPKTRSRLEVDDDWDHDRAERAVPIWDRGQRGGQDEAEIESDSYAISIDPTFRRAAMRSCLRSIERTAAVRGLLVPIIAGEVSAGTITGLVRIVSLVGESTLTSDNGGEPIRAIVYNARPIILNDEDTFSQGLTVTLLDFGQSPTSNINKPNTPEGAVLTSRTLDSGSIVLARKIGDQDLYVSSTLTHYDVTCI